MPSSNTQSNTVELIKKTNEQEQKLEHLQEEIETNKDTLAVHEGLVKQNINDIAENKATLSVHEGLVTENTESIKKIESDMYGELSEEQNVLKQNSKTVWLNIDFSDWLMRGKYSENRRPLTDAIIKTFSSLTRTIISHKNNKQKTIKVTIENEDYPHPLASYDVENMTMAVKLSALENPNNIGPDYVDFQDNVPWNLNFNESTYLTNWFFHTAIHLLALNKTDIEPLSKTITDDNGIEWQLYTGVNGLKQYKNMLRKIKLLAGYSFGQPHEELSEDKIDRMEGFLIRTDSNNSVHFGNVASDKSVTFHDAPVIVYKGETLPILQSISVGLGVYDMENIHSVILGIFEDLDYIVDYNSPLITVEDPLYSAPYVFNPVNPSNESALKVNNNESALKVNNKSSLKNNIFNDLRYKCC